MHAALATLTEAADDVLEGDCLCLHEVAIRDDGRQQFMNSDEIDEDGRRVLPNGIKPWYMAVVVSKRLASVEWAALIALGRRQSPHLRGGAG